MEREMLYYIIKFLIHPLGSLNANAIYVSPIFQRKNFSFVMISNTESDSDQASLSVTGIALRAR